MTVDASHRVTADPKARIRILCVDDEPSVLEGLSLHLRRRYDVTTAENGTAALEALQSHPGIAVILSDLRMPGMDGATFLARARQACPDAVRLLLTGQADVDAAIAAINEGQIFRFLTKPCPPAALLAAFQSAAEQHRLVTAERVLLEQTLRGSIKMLTDVLALANPTAFGRATRIKERAVELAGAAGVEPLWQVEVAALLSQVGCVTLPTAMVDKLYHGQPLSPDEQALAEGLPFIADRLLANIPRLDEIRAALVNLGKTFDGSGPPANGLRGETIPVAARVLRLCIDLDALEAQGDEPAVAFDTLRGRTGHYDPRLLAALAALAGSREKRYEIREIPLRLVAPGMTFAQDVKTPAGALLLPRGYEVTEGLLGRIRNFSVKGNVRVILGPVGRDEHAVIEAMKQPIT